MKGAAGYVGSKLVLFLERAGHQVVSLVRTTSGPSKSGITIDLSNQASRSLNFEHVDTIIHCARAAHKRFGNAESVFQAAKLKAAAKLARAAVDSHVKRRIMVSTVSCYGNEDYGSLNDESCELKAQDAYGRSKRDGETAAAEVVCESNREFIAVRPSTVVGPKAAGNMRELISLLNRIRFISIGDGNNFKSLILFIR